MRATAIAIASALICAGTLAAETRVVSTTIKGETKLRSSIYREEAEGAFLRIREEAEDGSVEALLAADGTVASTDLRTKDGDVRMSSDGKVVDISGTWRGKPVSGRYELKGLGFYGSGFTFALRALAKGGLSALRFPMIDVAKPEKSAVMELRREGTDSFKGKLAIKVKISLTGVMSALWSGHILIGEDGMFLRYEGNQGPGTPTMVSELVEIKK